MKKWLLFGLPFLLTVALIILGETRWGKIPPLGSFLSPGEGFWQNALYERLPGQNKIKLSLQREVKILWDQRQIPHIFAQNDRDLYYTFGYITARDRLWQMEIQTYLAAGRLSEILGKAGLKKDLQARQLGMLESSKKALQKFDSHPESKAIAEAYCQGVNDYIKSLRPRDYPLEYKLLGYQPEPWTLLKSVLLLKFMAWNLTGRYLFHEVKMANFRDKFQEKEWQELFYSWPESQPVIPEGTPFSFQPLPLQRPEKIYTPKARDYVLSYDLPPSGQGSNNWAVSGKKTQSGLPILSSDPHLQLSLPAIWYEAQLSSPNVNVYGVAIPGSPVILIGFNSQIAWGVTNSEADVTDLYEIEFQDSTQKKYRYKGEWKDTTFVEEKILVKGGATVFLKVPYTHHGPIAFMSQSSQGKLGLALRWSGHEPSNEMGTFLSLNRAKNYEDYCKALTFYRCPAQNFAFASLQGDIAIWHNGRLPAKWQGQGVLISDGNDPSYEWKWIPREQLPHIKNPERGFVSSANQYPVEHNYPYFFGGWFEQYRNKRINQVLSGLSKITAKDMEKLQTDTYDMHAASILPTLLKVLDESHLKGSCKSAYQELSRWDYHNDGEKISPSIFQEWWKRLFRAVWEDEMENGPYPSREKTVDILIHNKERWIDDRRTKNHKETLAEIASSTLENAISHLEKLYGPLGPKWAWGNHKAFHLQHMAKIPGFGRKLFLGGSEKTVNAIAHDGGPSWRMVVELGLELKAWGCYPGGQSGNPGSPHYDDFVDSWVKGNYYELNYFKNSDVTSNKVQSIWIIEGK